MLKRIKIQFFGLVALLMLSKLAFAAEPKLGICNYKLPLNRLENGAESNFWDNVRFGGNLGLQFGNPTYVLLSPSIAYIPPAEILDEKLMLGLGVTYIYSKVKYADVNYVSNIYGGRLFARYLVTDNLFAYTEYESLNAPNYINDNSQRTWVNSFFVGGGYLQSVGGRGGFSVTVLYNLAWTPNNLIYSSPWNIRFGVMF